MSPQARFIALIGLPAALALGILIPKDEGVVLKTYRDPVGILTSCMGHTGPELKLGQTFTRAECETTMYTDLLKHTEPVIKCMGQGAWDRMPAYKRVAIIDFTFNKGVAAFCGSTYKAQLVAGNPRACEQPKRWVMANGGRVDCRIRSNNCFGVVLRGERNARMCTGDMSNLGLDGIDFAPDGATPEGTQ
ncbi:Lysozyme RrrD [compost metagenome]